MNTFKNLSSETVAKKGGKTTDALLFLDHFLDQILQTSREKSMRKSMSKK